MKKNLVAALAAALTIGAASTTFAAAEVIDEEGMTALYGLLVHIGQIGTRTVCVGGDIA